MRSSPGHEAHIHGEENDLRQTGAQNGRKERDAAYDGKTEVLESWLEFKMKIAAASHAFFISSLGVEEELSLTSSVYRLIFRASTQQCWQTMMSSKTTPDSSLLTR